MINEVCLRICSQWLMCLLLHAIATIFIKQPLERSRQRSTWTLIFQSLKTCKEFHSMETFVALGGKFQLEILGQSGENVKPWRGVSTCVVNCKTFFECLSNYRPQIFIHGQHGHSDFRLSLHWKSKVLLANKFWSGFAWSTRALHLNTLAHKFTLWHVCASFSTNGLKLMSELWLNIQRRAKELTKVNIIK